MPLEAAFCDMSQSNSVEPRKLRRATLKEELYVLTGDMKDAIILNELIRCQARVRHIEAYIEEEQKRLASHGQVANIAHLNGWFYKKSEELSEEAMIGLSKSNMRTRLMRFVDKGWLYEKDNDVNKWNKTKLYRVPIIEIDRQLQVLGYRLDGWLIKQIDPSRPLEGDSDTSDEESELRGSETEPRNSEIEFGGSKTENGGFEIESQGSDSKLPTSTLGTSTVCTSDLDTSTTNKHHASQHEADDDDDYLISPKLAVPPATTSNEHAASLTPTSLAPAPVPQVDLVANLVAAGVVKNDVGKGEKFKPGAITLAATKPDVCVKWLEWLPYQLSDMKQAGNPARNPGGLLADAIRNDWPAPLSWQAAQEAAERATEAQKRAAEIRAAQEAAKQQERTSFEAEVARLEKVAAAAMERFRYLSEKEQEAVLAIYTSDPVNDFIVARAPGRNVENISRADNHELWLRHGAALDIALERYDDELQEMPQREEATPTPVPTSSAPAAGDPESQRLDKIFASLDAKTQSRLEAETKKRLSLMGPLGDSDAALASMRRTVLREMLGQARAESQPTDGETGGKEAVA